MLIRSKALLRLASSEKSVSACEYALLLCLAIVVFAIAALLLN
jgi:hypothetical protein